ncbi:MAG: nuclear transport factor 2 family protein [Acidimicrobiia bacterium]|nr:nuclear transport factor 2 family protein [Acidimicrobiia bacterium]NNC75366.1 hypothetical protein [Acidimicrobiia bacterium]
MENPNDTDAVAAAAADYIEGWYHGDAARMDRALHDELMKRTVDEEGSLRVVTKERMIELTESGGGEDPDAEFEIVVDGISGDIASARTLSPEYVDHLHLLRTSQGWKITNVLFRIR